MQRLFALLNSKAAWAAVEVGVLLAAAWLLWQAGDKAADTMAYIAIALAASAVVRWIGRIAQPRGGPFTAWAIVGMTALTVLTLGLQLFGLAGWAKLLGFVAMGVLFGTCLVALKYDAGIGIINRIED